MRCLCQILTFNSYSQDKQTTTKKGRQKQKLSIAFLLELHYWAEWMNDLNSSQIGTIYFYVYLLQHCWSQLTQLRFYILPAMYKKVWDSSDYFMEDGYLLRTRIAKMQTFLFRKYLCLFRIWFQSKCYCSPPPQKKDIQWTRNSENGLFKEQRDQLFHCSLQFVCLISPHLLRSWGN